MAIHAQKKAEKRQHKIERGAGLNQVSAGRMRPPKRKWSEQNGGY